MKTFKPTKQTVLKSLLFATLGLNFASNWLDNTQSTQLSSELKYSNPRYQYAPTADTGSAEGPITSPWNKTIKACGKDILLADVIKEETNKYIVAMHEVTCRTRSVECLKNRSGHKRLSDITQLPAQTLADAKSEASLARIQQFIEQRCKDFFGEETSTPVADTGRRDERRAGDKRRDRRDRDEGRRERPQDDADKKMSDKELMCEVDEDEQKLDTLGQLECLHERVKKVKTTRAGELNREEKNNLSKFNARIEALVNKIRQEVRSGLRDSSSSKRADAASLAEKASELFNKMKVFGDLRTFESLSKEFEGFEQAAKMRDEGERIDKETARLNQEAKMQADRVKKMTENYLSAVQSYQRTRSQYDMQRAAIYGQGLQEAQSALQASRTSAQDLSFDLQMQMSGMIGSSLGAEDKDFFMKQMDTSDKRLQALINGGQTPGVNGGLPQNIGQYRGTGAQQNRNGLPGMVPQQAGYVNPALLMNNGVINPALMNQALLTNPNANSLAIAQQQMLLQQQQMARLQSQYGVMATQPALYGAQRGVMMTPGYTQNGIMAPQYYTPSYPMMAYPRQNNFRLGLNF